MIERKESKFPLHVQAGFYGIMSFISFGAAVSGILLFNNLTLFSAGVLLFALTYPLTLLTGAGYLVLESMKLEKQLEGMPLGEGEDAELDEMVEDMAEMFAPIEDEEEEEDTTLGLAEKGVDKGNEGEKDGE